MVRVQYIVGFMHRLGQFKAYKIGIVASLHLEKRAKTGCLGWSLLRGTIK